MASLVLSGLIAQSVEFVCNPPRASGIWRIPSGVGRVLSRTSSLPGSRGRNEIGGACVPARSRDRRGRLLGIRAEVDASRNGRAKSSNYVASTSAARGEELGDEVGQVTHPHTHASVHARTDARARARARALSLTGSEFAAAGGQAP
jgi:hypothetical protein